MVSPGSDKLYSLGGLEGPRPSKNYLFLSLWKSGGSSRVRKRCEGGFVSLALPRTVLVGASQPSGYNRPYIQLKLTSAAQQRSAVGTS
jgi:hypothetical protein